MEGLFRENRILCLTVRLTRVTKEISKAEIRYFLSATSKYQKYQPKYAKSHVNTCISGGQGGIRSPYAPSKEVLRIQGFFSFWERSCYNSVTITLDLEKMSFNSYHRVEA